MSKVFCDKPWNHNYVHTNGKVRLCCTTIQNITKDDNYHQFDLNKDSVHSYWNSDRMKKTLSLCDRGSLTRDASKKGTARHLTRYFFKLGVYLNFVVYICSSY